ncbi:MAG TPA: alpha/beta fold hydrolase [Anaerolineales bacterium]|nr:alpha/beta fold hydrolase [Anaerolineales bacterium]
MDQDTLYVLIHSPLVGPLTWSLVADEMRRRGVEVSVPTLTDSPDSDEPFWKQQAQSVSQSLAQIPADTALILVAHSGAGSLLPVIRRRLPNPINAYVFVDAGLPQNGATRIDMMRSENLEWATQFQELLEAGGRFPTWSFAELQEAIPDESLRWRMLDEIRPRGLDFFTEPIPVFDGWPDAPCAYIQFSAAYERPALRARQQGWITEQLTAGHFHMLVDPKVVADKILDVVNKAIGL